MFIRSNLVYQNKSYLKLLNASIENLSSKNLNLLKNIQLLSVNESNLEHLRYVYLIKQDGKSFILKHILEYNVGFGRNIKSFLFGSFYYRLYKKLLKINKPIYSITQNILAIKETRKSLKKIETYILFDYIEGQSLDKCSNPEQYKEDILKIMLTLHKFKIASGDLNIGNFIVQKDEIKIIDLSNRSLFSKAKIKDAIYLKKYYDIDYPIKQNLLFKLIKWKQLRNQ